jgi:2,3-dihydroxybiphenyl 1,2-dioxygenase
MAAVSGLAYLGFSVRHPDSVGDVFVGVIGFEAAGEDTDGTRAFRMDERARRILLHPGAADDIAYAGWEVASRADLESITARLRDAGVDVRRGSAAEAAARGVEEFVAFADPDGLRTELCVDPRAAAAPFRHGLVASGFVTGAEGLGHILVAARDAARTEAFYRDLLGFRLSDHVHAEAEGMPVRATFLHANQRHHSFAFLEAPLPKKLHHFMVEANAIDDVGLAYDRCRGAGIPILRTLGRHENDKMVSFYAATPAGFAFEFGWGARKVDDRVWKPTVWNRISEWGHHPPSAGAPAFVAQH